MTAPLQAVGCVRLSRLNDASTSPERQRGVVRGWANQQSADVVGMPEDLDVSGSVSPFERPELGPWLTDTPPAPWSVLVAWRLDRVSRSALDTLQLLEWLEARGKRLVTVDDGVDTGTQMGRLFVQIAGIFAQLERETIRERTLASRQALRAAGRWGGEAVHYGYRAVPIPTGGYRLDVDEAAAEVVRRIYARYLDGQSAARITRDLQRDEILAPRDRQRLLREQPLKDDRWSEGTVLKLLRSRSVLGWTIHKGEADSTNPKAPAIIPAETFQRVQAEVEQRANRLKHVPRRTSSPLAGVALCWECLQPLHLRRQTVPAGRSRMKETRVYCYYYCRHKGHTKQVRAEKLEQMCVSAFLATYSAEPILEPVEHPATDHSEELASLRLIIQDLAQRLGQTQSEAVRAALGAQLDQAGQREAELAAEPVEAARVELVPTGTTWADELETLDEYQRRDRWLKVGFRFAVQSTDQGVTVAIRPPETWGLEPGVYELSRGTDA